MAFREAERNQARTSQQQQQQMQSQPQPQPPAGISNVSSSVAASLASASVAVASAGGGSGGGPGGGGSAAGGSTSGAIGGPLTMAGLAEPRFPPAIAVQRLAPQVQRQLRETQELIKDSCAQLYGSAYGSPGPPSAAVVAASSAGGVPGVSGPPTGPAGPLRTGPGSVLARATARRPTLETQYSQELS
ncbi:putative lysozyme-like protein [Anopheles ziemanni]|uniref:putative lysozyme-like protein n=1 Tax=Anopheles ziemanni TaxID=345580 RepID=UPI00265E71DF|nr:putative lysozyme-like protein [Anopheles ziemanni]